MTGELTDCCSNRSSVGLTRGVQAHYQEIVPVTHPRTPTWVKVSPFFLWNTWNWPVYKNNQRFKGGCGSDRPLKNENESKIPSKTTCKHPNTGNRSFVFSVLFTLYSGLIRTSPFRFGTKYKFHHKCLTTFTCVPNTCIQVTVQMPQNMHKYSREAMMTKGVKGGGFTSLQDSLFWDTAVTLKSCPSHNNFLGGGNQIFMQTEWNNSDRMKQKVALLFWPNAVQQMGLLD